MKSLIITMLISMNVFAADDVLPGMSEAEMRATKVCKNIGRYTNKELYKGIFKVFRCFDSNLKRKTKEYSYQGETIVTMYKNIVVKAEVLAPVDDNEKAFAVNKTLKEYNIVKKVPKTYSEYELELTRDGNNLLVVSAYEVHIIRKSADYQKLRDMEKAMLDKHFSADSNR